MKFELTFQEKAKDLRIKSGLSLDELSKATGVGRSSLGKYETQDDPAITAASLKALCTYHNVSADYLIGLTDNENLEAGDFSELNIDDATLEVLKNGKFNHRLLCEIIKHPALEKLLADIEIYVDGLATMNVNAFNSLVDLARQEILGKYHPDEDDYHMRVLNSSTIDEYQYFLQQIQSDLGSIIKDIKQNHIGEKETAPKTSLIKSFKDSLDYASEIKGTAIDKEFLVLCKNCGVNPNKVSDLEKSYVISFMKKSKKFNPRIH